MGKRREVPVSDRPERAPYNDQIFPYQDLHTRIAKMNKKYDARAAKWVRDAPLTETTIAAGKEDDAAFRAYMELHAHEWTIC
jgi:hypothetical protein